MLGLLKFEFEIPSLHHNRETEALSDAKASTHLTERPG